jgi:glutamate-1-semialdehyde 2,1-aminomutase
MAAGLAMLEALNKDAEVFDRLANKTAYLHKGLEKVFNEAGVSVQINRFGSMVSVHFTDTAVVDFKTSALGNNDRFKTYFHGMLDRGIYLPPSAFESYFLNDALTYEDLDKTIAALAEFVEELK